jgi:hypothetical protein
MQKGSPTGAIDPELVALAGHKAGVNSAPFSASQPRSTHRLSAPLYSATFIEERAKAAGGPP